MKKKAKEKGGGESIPRERCRAKGNEEKEKRNPSGSQLVGQSFGEYTEELEE